MSHVTHMIEPCYMLHIWMHHVTNMNGSCHTCEQNTPAVKFLGPRQNAFLWIQQHFYRHVAILLCAMTHLCVWHDSRMCVTWLIHTCDTSHSYAWHDSFTRVTRLIHICHESFTCVPWLIHVWSFGMFPALLRDMINSHGAPTCGTLDPHVGHLLHTTDGGDRT